MIIQAYPTAFDTSSLQPLTARRSGLGAHVIGSAIMVTLMGLVAQATYLRLAQMLSHPAETNLLDYLAETGSFCFACLIGVLCVIRLKPSQQARGAIPVIAALGGSFLLTAVNLAPIADLSQGVKTIAVFLLAVGNVLSVYCLAYLGRAFSILPQARKLVTEGPYALVRHPLYVAEAIAALGLILLHFSAFSVITGLTLLAIQMQRVIYEERVLLNAFPDYAVYAARTPRFIPKFWNL